MGLCFMMDPPNLHFFDAFALFSENWLMNLIASEKGKYKEREELE